MAQAVCHMTDSLLYGLNRRTIYTRIKPPLPAGLYKWLALNCPTKWPKGVPTTPEMTTGTATASLPLELTVTALRIGCEVLATHEGPDAPLRRWPSAMAPLPR